MSEAVRFSTQLGAFDFGSSARAMPESGNVHSPVAVMNAVDEGEKVT
jgi:hypothetical protein